MSNPLPRYSADRDYSAWINQPLAVRYLQREPDDIVQSIDNTVLDAESVREVQSWSLGGQLGRLLAYLVNTKGIAPDLSMILTQGVDQDVTIAILLSTNGNAVVAQHASFQLMVDLVVTGWPRNLPAESTVTVAVPAGTVSAPVAWAGGRQGILEVSGDADKPWQIIWGDRVDEAHVTPQANPR